jgi:hypothetical protein
MWRNEMRLITLIVPLMILLLLQFGVSIAAEVKVKEAEWKTLPRERQKFVLEELRKRGDEIELLRDDSKDPACPVCCFDSPPCNRPECPKAIR